MRQRNCSVLVRLNRAEMERLDKTVKKTGLSREGYIRQLINGNVPKELPPMDFYDVLKELRQINVNMNQIALKANSIGFIDVSEYRLNTKALQSAVGRIMEKLFD